MVQLRVHIIPVGFEEDRVVLPALDWKADRVHLISQTVDNKAKKFLSSAEAAFKKDKIPVLIEEADRTDLFGLLSVFRKIIEQEQSNQIFINVSSGAKMHTIAAVMAAMLFKEESHNIELYYAQPTHYRNEENPKPMSTGLQKMISIPIYKARRPEKSLVDAMSFISKEGEVSKKKLIEHFFPPQELIRMKDGLQKQRERSKKHMWVNQNIINKLIEWKVLDMDGYGRKMRLRLNQNGKNFIKFLG